MAFPRQVRLTRPGEFQHVFERGRHRKFSGQGLMARVRENDVQYARLGLAISKRNLRRAVDRNLVKRLARESFRHYQAKLPAVDIVILSQPSLLGMPNSDIAQQLELIWQQVQRQYSSRPRSNTT
ncbi:MAG: ribonuclease P protein component [Thiofilum sp.]|uniref:ribonuclease P protein component n=1 Tax=Thiofilum sp. TaxID=2212733 RepID=UPI0025EF680F|nr:ribonuclease P protein component [Thiofilum sp.]MBK8452658.1 ribonuclease P protein component [Thiofilum sp.]